MATIEDLKKFQDELKAEFGADANIAYANVSSTQLSISRHYGGATIQGKNFVYSYADDSLIRRDVVKWIAKRQREARKRAISSIVSDELPLLDGDVG